MIPYQIKAGIPSQLLKNRPDIKRAELELMAAKMDVKTAQYEFYPSVGITGRLGIQAFKPGYLLTIPESLMYSLIGDLAGPILNRKALIAEFKNANAYQIQALYEYQKTILNGFVEVANELSNITNLENMYVLKSKEAQVQAISIDIAHDLFKAARANYLEVLTTQREALETKLELVEIKKRQFISVTNIYRALGGGWK
jgi:outer membrane protein TolC